ncbi:MAG: FkbM family methyltransferase [Bacteroidia bacterium]
MNTTTLSDGTKVFCLNKPEAKVLDSHISGYFQHGIHIKEHDVVFDVGANIGVFGLRTLQRFTHTQVFAFEPIPFIHEVLEANAKAYASRFHTFQLGVGKEVASFPFKYFPFSPALSTAHPEIWEKNPEDLARATHSQLQKLPKGFRFLRFLPLFVSKIIAKILQANAVTVQCQIIPLSHIIDLHRIECIHLLKIDCEGAEYDVLLGIREEHWGKIQQIVAEVYNQDSRVEKVKQLLEAKGFTKIVIEEDDDVKGANLYNVYATKS